MKNSIFKNKQTKPQNPLGFLNWLEHKKNHSTIFTITITIICYFELLPLDLLSQDKDLPLYHFTSTSKLIVPDKDVNITKVERDTLIARLNRTLKLNNEHYDNEIDPGGARRIFKNKINPIVDGLSGGLFSKGLGGLRNVIEKDAELNSAKFVSKRK